MLEAEKAAFSFEEFKVPKFSYDEGNDITSNLRLGFSPSGKYYSKDGVFEITLLFEAHDNDNIEKPVFELTCLAKFKFNSKIELLNIPSFFYVNSIAIMFPYVRAFVSTLTLQANSKLLKLELMNLTDLAKPLKENTVEIK